MTPSRDVEEYIESIPWGIQPLLRAARELVLEALPEVEERVLKGWHLIGYYQYGYLGFVSGHAGGVRLGFERGALLSDPLNLLEGRHLRSVRTVSIRSMSDLSRPGLIELWQDALLLNLRRQAARPGSRQRK